MTDFPAVLYAKAYATRSTRWGWVLCSDPDDWAGSQVLASVPDEPKQEFNSQESALSVAVSHGRQRALRVERLP